DASLRLEARIDVAQHLLAGSGDEPAPPLGGDIGGATVIPAEGRERGIARRGLVAKGQRRGHSPRHGAVVSEAVAVAVEEPFQELGLPEVDESDRPRKSGQAVAVGHAVRCFAPTEVQRASRGIAPGDKGCRQEVKRAPDAVPEIGERSFAISRKIAMYAGE